MLFGAFDIAPLEIRKRRDGSRRVRGRFPYNKRAVLSDGGTKGGRPQKEVFAPNAFAYRVNLVTEDIFLLVGHDFGFPLASKATQTLLLTDSAEALTFEATITPAIAETSYGADILKQIEAGLSVGLSPGFRLPPPRAVAKPETFTDEGFDPARGMHNALIRTINAALLYELSIVTRPAYTETTVQADDAPDDTQDATQPPLTAPAFPALTAPVPLLRPVPIVKPVQPVLARWRL